MTRKLLLILLCLMLAVSATAQMRILPTAGSAVTGTISSIHGNTILLFDGRITIDATGAEVRDSHAAATVADLRAGDRIMASVEAPTAPDDALRARVIQVLPPTDSSLHGTVEAVDPAAGTLRVLGQTIRVTSSTILRGFRGMPLNSLAEVRPGEEVRIELDRSEPDLTARVVMVMAPFGGIHSAVAGLVEAIDDNVWTIRADDRTLRIVATDQTQVVGTPRAGDRVTVIYRTDAAGQHFALSIALTPESPRPPQQQKIVFVGTVFSIRGNVWDIEGMKITITRNTKLINAPGLGDRVHVVAAQNSQGTFALEIETVF